MSQDKSANVISKAKQLMQQSEDSVCQASIENSIRECALNVAETVYKELQIHNIESIFWREVIAQIKVTNL